MKYTGQLLNFVRVTTAVATAAMVMALGSTASADVFTGGGDGTSWEDPLNWAGGIVPLINSTNFQLNHNHQVVYDAGTWAYLDTNSLLHTSVQHRIARMLIGGNNNASNDGTHSLTMDQGAGRTALFTNGTSHVVGQRSNKHSTLDIFSGTTNIQANVIVGSAANSSGTINVNGGELIVSREGLDIGLAAGLGTVNVTAGSLTTRAYVDVGGNGIFDVVGSSASLIGVGSNGSLDGAWEQASGGILRSGVDGSGVTDILVDDVDGVLGTGGDGIATFQAGSILDPYNAGGALFNVWDTVLLAEGGIVGAPTLSATSVAAGWESQIINGNELQVRLVAVPEPSSLAFLGLGSLLLVRRRRK